jgi:formylglycine-generating enzyme required for sulfatase activity
MGVLYVAEQLSTWNRSGVDGGARGTCPVKSFPPGHNFLYDMGGNVDEWTSSKFCPYSSKGCNDARHVARGGSYILLTPWGLERARRSAIPPMVGVALIGVRCAK